MYRQSESDYKDHPVRGGDFFWNFRSNSAFFGGRGAAIMRNFTGGGRRWSWNCQTVLVLFLCLGVLLTFLNVSRLQEMISHCDLSSSKAGSNKQIPAKTFTVHGRRVDSGYLRHVFDTFTRFGYSRVNLNETSDWNVLWSHDYPFKTLADEMSSLKPNQKVNHFPGSGFITNKMNLATSDLPYVPKAFQLPKDKDNLIAHAKANPHKRFVQKSNNHRGIKIEKLDALDLTKDDTFIQEYIGNPLLIDGHKFDIGVYTVITSINPVRIYVYKDVLFRFCPETYHPFDPDVVDKYVVGDDYLPLWKVPSLQKYYSDLGFGMKDSFDSWWDSTRGATKPSSDIWAQVEAAIPTIVLSKESSIMSSIARFPGDGRQFFEMVRFDFVIDDDGHVFIMEANMSPNLSSAHFPPNALLYEQVLFNLFNLVGIASGLVGGRSNTEGRQVSAKHLAVYAKECFDDKCLHDCKETVCALCSHCLDDEMTNVLKSAYLEHVNRMDCRRIFPPSKTTSKRHWKQFDISKVSKINQIQKKWFEGKCLLDESFC